jgi:hypothetical protein
MRGIPLLFISLSLSSGLVACASASGRGGNESAGIAGKREGPGISRIELQDSLMRFEASFNEDMREAFRGVEKGPDPSLRRHALKNRLDYASSALAISIGSVPEANLLDMVAFIQLCQGVFDRYWMPKVYGNDGAPVSGAFKHARSEILALAARVLTPAQLERFQRALDDWQRANPDRIAVEGIRFTQISAATGEKAAEVEDEASGLMSNLKSITIATDQMALLGERSLHYAQQLPFLLRMQARLAAQEVLGDVSGTPVVANGEFFMRDTTVWLDRAARFLKEYAQARGQGPSPSNLDWALNHILLKLGLWLMVLIAFAGLIQLGVRRLSAD